MTNLDDKLLREITTSMYTQLKDLEPDHDCLVNNNCVYYDIGICQDRGMNRDYINCGEFYKHIWNDIEIIDDNLRKIQKLRGDGNTGIYLYEK